jgi:hypothetical protein
MAVIYADHDIATETVAELRQLGHQVTTTRALHQERASDALQLWTAAIRRSILISHNANDYRLLHEAWHRWGVDRAHAAIILFPHWDGLLREWTPTRAARELSAFINQHPIIDNERWRWVRNSGWTRDSGQSEPP